MCLFRGPRGARKDGEGEEHGMGKVDGGWIDGYGGEEREGDQMRFGMRK